MVFFTFEDPDEMLEVGLCVALVLNLLADERLLHVHTRVLGLLLLDHEFFLDLQNLIAELLPVILHWRHLYPLKLHLILCRSILVIKLSI